MHRHACEPSSLCPLFRSRLCSMVRISWDKSRRDSGSNRSAGLTEAKGGWWRSSAWKENCTGGLKRGAYAPASVSLVAFVICTVTTVYDERRGLVHAIERLSSKNATLGANLRGKDSAIADLHSKLGDALRRLKEKNPSCCTRTATSLTGATNYYE